MVRRIYNTEGKSAPLWAWRLFSAILLPFLLVWVFADELFRNIRHGFRYAWLETSGEFQAFRRMWHGGTFNQIDEDFENGGGE